MKFNDFLVSGFYPEVGEGDALFSHDIIGIEQQEEPLLAPVYPDIEIAFLAFYREDQYTQYIVSFFVDDYLPIPNHIDKFLFSG